MTRYLDPLRDLMAALTAARCCSCGRCIDHNRKGCRVCGAAIDPECPMHGEDQPDR